MPKRSLHAPLLEVFDEGFDVLELPNAIKAIHIAARGRGRGEVVEGEGGGGEGAYREYGPAGGKRAIVAHDLRDRGPGVRGWREEEQQGTLC